MVYLLGQVEVHFQQFINHDECLKLWRMPNFKFIIGILKNKLQNKCISIYQG